MKLVVDAFKHDITGCELIKPTKVFHLLARQHNYCSYYRVDIMKHVVAIPTEP